MRSLVGTRPQADALRARVDAALGLPRCERLSGGLVELGDPRVRLTCTCTVATSPVVGCLFATHAEALPTPLLDATWAYPVNEAKAALMATLTAPERAAVVTVAATAINRTAVIARP